MIAERQPSALELVKELADETGTLIRQELALARAEMVLKARSAAMSSSIVLVGAGVSLSSLLGLATTAVITLSFVIPLWLASLAVSLMLTLVGAVLLVWGIGRLDRLDPRPTVTMASLRDVAGLPPREQSALRGETTR